MALALLRFDGIVWNGAKLMEKNGRLQRYNRKDYTDLVEFPVEIVGRDGMVRRYSFEDSIRLYRRRITFAPIRYQDEQLVEAEAEHCRARIDQLRRSFFYRFGWGTPEGESSPLVVFGTLAGEIAAFFCRVLRCEGRPDIAVEPVLGAGSSPSLSVWTVVPRGSAQAMRLYVHRFDGTEATAELEDSREGFFSSLKRLERSGRMEPESERLVAFHHTVDCGFVLTAHGNEFDWLNAQREEDEEESGRVELTPWDEALEVIRRGGHTDGLARCREIVKEQPWHHHAYVGGALLALHVDQAVLAEEFALIGSKYFPDDAALLFYTGVARARQKRSGEAIAPLERALSLEPTSAGARLLLATALARQRQFGAARRVLRGKEGLKLDDRRATGMIHRLEQWLFWRAVIQAVGHSVALAGLLAVLLAGWAGLAPLAVGLAVAGSGGFGLQRELDKIENWQRFDDVLYGLRRLRRSPHGEELT